MYVEILGDIKDVEVIARDRPPPPRPSQGESSGRAGSSWKVWQTTPGALEWLAERTAIPVKQGKTRKGRKGKKKGRR